MRHNGVTTKDDRRGSARQQRATGTPQELNEELLCRLHWAFQRLITTALGAEPGEIHGSQPATHLRRIDWNSIQGDDWTYARESYVDRALGVWLLLDVSASDGWAAPGCLKRDRAIEFAAAAGRLLGQQGNRVGALLFADRPVSFVAPGAGRRHMMQMLASIQDEPRLRVQRDIDLRSALLQAGAMIQRRSLVLVVSDFAARDGWQSALGWLAERHEVVAVHLRDSRGGELPDFGIVTPAGRETGGRPAAVAGAAMLRERYQRASRGWDEAIGAAVAGHGIGLLVLNADDALLPALVNFLDIRRRRRALALAQPGLNNTRVLPPRHKDTKA
jgi:uncharacterized protein (DUF58 family)